MLTLKPVTLTSPHMPACIALDIAPHKKENEYVTPAAYTLAYAHDYNKRGIPYECRALYAGDEIVGLISYNYYTNDDVFTEVCYRIRPFLVDAKHQNKGYETEALRLLLAEIETQPCGSATAIFAAYNPKETDSASLYADAGFNVTDMNWSAEDPDDDDMIVRKSL